MAGRAIAVSISATVTPRSAMRCRACWVMRNVGGSVGPSPLLIGALCLPDRRHVDPSAGYVDNYVIRRNDIWLQHHTATRLPRRRAHHPAAQDRDRRLWVLLPRLRGALRRAWTTRMPADRGLTGLARDHRYAELLCARVTTTISRTSSRMVYRTRYSPTLKRHPSRPRSGRLAGGRGSSASIAMAPRRRAVSAGFTRRSALTADRVTSTR